MLKLFLFFTLVLVPGLSFSQVGNEWINYGQTYYKIPVAKDGLYKLTQENLAQAGVPVTQLDPRRLQLFHRGIEQAILVQHLQLPADGVFDAGEYLEFYGKRNDGTLDKFLYKPEDAQPHDYYNLYNDTAYYFLTVHPSVQGKRMSTFSQLNTSGLPTESHHISEQLQLFSSSYAVGETVNGSVQLTEFDQADQLVNGLSPQIMRQYKYVRFFFRFKGIKGVEKVIQDIASILTFQFENGEVSCTLALLPKSEDFQYFTDFEESVSEEEIAKISNEVIEHLISELNKLLDKK